jgi:hypothetical protein
MTSIYSLSTNPTKECILDRITLTPPWRITADVVVTMMSTIPERCSEKLILAACVIVDIDHFVACSARVDGISAVLTYSNYAGCQAIAGRFTPGGFYDRISKQSSV